MKIAACAFDVSGNVSANLRAMENAVQQAAAQGVRLIIFPECALSGYPPRSIAAAHEADWHALEKAMARLDELAEKHDMCIIAGTILKEGKAFCNSAAAFMPGRRAIYHKRALWGWDRENFVPGTSSGTFEFEGIQIGMRICYEVRFPEYFRELYRAETALNILLFYDVMDENDPSRYDLIRAHIRTRAAENVCPILSVNATRPYQTAPTGFYDASGRIVAELEPGKEGLLICNWLKTRPGFSEQGRIENNNMLLQR